MLALPLVLLLLLLLLLVILLALSLSLLICLLQHSLFCIRWWQLTTYQRACVQFTTAKPRAWARTR
jgi:hypothetical protein